ncbi:MAG: hypothetical protein GQ527_09515 [Bacteroidales bacterium]|nr:hypothetical protein [Bacteroidales bacterium]
MRIVKIVSLVILVVGLVFAFVKKDSIQQFFQEGEQEHIEEIDHQHGSADDQQMKPFYQGEVVSVEQGGGYTYLEILEKTDMTFWIAVDKAEVQLGDYVLFQEELVAKDFHSKALDRTFDEIMFASNLQYKVSE